MAVANARVPFPPADVWPLIADPAAWQLGGCAFAFDIDDGPAEIGRCRVLFWRQDGRGPIVCGLFRITLVEPERRFVAVHSSPGIPEWSFDFRVTPARRGSRVQVRTRIRGVPLQDLRFRHRTWSRQLVRWLDRLGEVLAGKRQRPSRSLSAEQARSFACEAPPGRTAREVVAEVDIDVPNDVVWRHLWEPRRGPTEAEVHAGVVPGTPVHAIGEMQYFVNKVDGMVHSSVVVVTDLEAGRFARVHQVGVASAVDHYVTPSDDGRRTRVRIVYRSADRGNGALTQDYADDVVRALKETIETAEAAR